MRQRPPKRREWPHTGPHMRATEPWHSTVLCWWTASHTAQAKCGRFPVDHSGSAWDGARRNDAHLSRCSAGRRHGRWWRARSSRPQVVWS